MVEELGWAMEDTKFSFQLTMMEVVVAQMFSLEAQGEVRVGCTFRSPCCVDGIMSLDETSKRRPKDRVGEAQPFTVVKVKSHKGDNKGAAKELGRSPGECCVRGPSGFKGQGTMSSV